MRDDPPFLVAAIARRGSDILLVRQYGPEGPDTTWALPGGRCEPGELMLDALRREPWEETGLHVDRVLGLANLAQLDNPTPHRRDRYEIPARGATATVIAFEVHVSLEATHVADPDGYVSGAEWVPAARVPAARAAQLLRAHPLAFTGLPAAARVSETPQAAARVWQLRRQPDGTDVVLHSSILSSPDV